MIHENMVDVIAVKNEEASDAATGDPARGFAVLLPPNLPAKSGEELRTWLRNILSRLRRDHPETHGALPYARETRGIQPARSACRRGTGKAEVRNATARPVQKPLISNFQQNG